ncbi:MAG: hypothetical protein V4665_04500 [Patescibacteria group bacterium]
METTASLRTVKVGFADFGSVEPEGLLSFNEPYLNHVEILKQYLQAHKGQLVPLLLKRIDHNGLLMEKIVTGRVGKIQKNHFMFSTTADISSTYEEPYDLLVRFDNPLGNIPMLPSARHIKFLRISDPFKTYVKALADMRKLLSEPVGTLHAATLYYHYTKEKPTFRNGNYRIKCNIIEVNKSNVMYEHLHTFAHVDSLQRYSDLGRRIDVDRFIAPDRYLKEVSVTFGQRHEINFHDDTDFPN